MPDKGQNFVLSFVQRRAKCIGYWYWVDILWNTTPVSSHWAFLTDDKAAPWGQGQAGLCRSTTSDGGGRWESNGTRGAALLSHGNGDEHRGRASRLFQGRVVSKGRGKEWQRRERLCSPLQLRTVMKPASFFQRMARPWLWRNSS